MAFCSNCGNQINNDPSFCPFCGMKRNPIASQGAQVVQPIQANQQYVAPVAPQMPQTPMASPISVAPTPEPPDVYEGELPFELGMNEKLAMVLEKTSYQARGALQLTNTFLTNLRLIFVKKGKNESVVVEFPISDIQITNAGLYNSGSKIQFSVSGFQEAENVTMLMITQFHLKDNMRGNERDKFVTKLNELKAAATPIDTPQASNIGTMEDATGPAIDDAGLEPEPKVITAPPPVIIEDKQTSIAEKEKVITTVSAMIAKLKDAIPDQLEKEWAKAVREDNEENIALVGKEIVSYVNDYVEIVTNDKLNEGEEIQWMHVINNGVLKKTVAEKWVITNQRAYVLRAGSDGILKKDGYAGLASINVVVMNQHRKSNSTHVGTYVGRRGVGVGSGRSSSTSTSYGDLVFMSQGKELFRFSGISDPNGVKRMVETLKKQTKV